MIIRDLPKTVVFPRRVLLMGFAALFFLAGCVSEKDVTVRFWCGFTGPDGRTMLRMIQAFNEEHPESRALMQRMDWGTYYNKLFVAGLGDRAPEVFIVHVDNLERFLRAGFIDSIDDLMKGPAGLDENDFLPNIWAAVAREGLHYGLPLDVHPQGLFYNKSLFRTAGIVDETGEPRPPTNREEFMGALEKLTRDTSGDGRMDEWGFVFTWFRTNMVTVVRQFGGSFFSEDFRRCVLTDEGTVAAFTFAADLVQRGLVPSPDNYDSWIGFRQGRVAMAFEGIYMLADLEKQSDLDWGAAPAPVLGMQPAVWANSHVMCLRSGLDAETREASWRLMRFLSENTLDWAVGGQVPVRYSQINSDRFRGMYAQHEFARQLDYIAYMPPVPFIFEFFTEFDRAVERTLRGSAPPEQALREAEETVNLAIQRYLRLHENTGRGEP